MPAGRGRTRARPAGPAGQSWSPCCGRREGCPTVPQPGVAISCRDRRDASSCAAPATGSFRITSLRAACEPTCPACSCFLAAKGASAAPLLPSRARLRPGRAAGGNWGDINGVFGIPTRPTRHFACESTDPTTPTRAPRACEASIRRREPSCTGNADCDLQPELFRVEQLPLSPLAPLTLTGKKEGPEKCTCHGRLQPSVTAAN